jgi:pantothenate synthetase
MFIYKPLSFVSSIYKTITGSTGFFGQQDAEEFIISTHLINDVGITVA